MLSNSKLLKLVSVCLSMRPSLATLSQLVDFLLPIHYAHSLNSRELQSKYDKNADYVYRPIVRKVRGLVLSTTP